MMKEDNLLFFVLVFFVGMCFRKTMCNNVLIEGEETYKRTCNNIDANELNKRFDCGGGKLKDNPQDIMCKSNGIEECTGELCCDPKKGDNNGDHDPKKDNDNGDHDHDHDHDNDNDNGQGFFIGLLITIFVISLLITIAHPWIGILLFTVYLIGFTVVFSGLLQSESLGLITLGFIILFFELVGGLVLAGVAVKYDNLLEIFRALVS